MLLPRLSQIKIRLTSSEEQQATSALNYISTVMIAGTEEELHILTGLLANFPSHILIWLCQKNHDLEIFLRTHEDFLQQLKGKLTATNHLAIEIKSMDEYERYTIFDLYLAAGMMMQFANTKLTAAERYAALSYACELGANDALIARCRYNEHIIKDLKKSPDQRNMALMAILSDAKLLAKRYWGIGYMQAGCILHALSEHFRLHPQNQDAIKQKTLIETAVRYFLCAALLENNDYSNVILDEMTQGKGLISLFQKTDTQINDWESIKNVFKEWLNNRYTTIEAEATAEIAHVFKEAEINNALKLAGQTFLSEFYSNYSKLIEAGIKENIHAGSAELRKTTVHDLLSAYLILKDRTNDYCDELVCVCGMLGLNIHTWDEAQEECRKLVDGTVFANEYETTQALISDVQQEWLSS